MMHPDRMPSISVGVLVPTDAVYDTHHHWWTAAGELRASVGFQVGGYSRGHIQGAPAALRELAAALILAGDQADATVPAATVPAADPARPAREAVGS